MTKRRHDSNDDEWFEVPFDALPPGPHKKLRLMADAQFPKPIANELRAAGIDVQGPDATLRGRDDAEVLEIARRAGRVLLTYDADFWDDRKHPLQRTPGVIVLMVPPADTESALRAFGLVHGAFARYMPGDWWEGVKARVNPKSFFLKVWGWDGKTAAWEIRIDKRRAMAREL